MVSAGCRGKSRFHNEYRYTELRVMQYEYEDLRAGDRLREIIRGRGNTIKGFAENLGIPYRSMQDYIAGKSKPGFDQLQKLSMAGIDVGYILTGKATIHQIYKLDDHLNASKLLASDSDLVELIIHYLPDLIDEVMKEVPDSAFLGSVSWPVVALWENAALIAAKVADELSDSIMGLRCQGVSAHSAVQMILEATKMQLLAKVRAGEVP